MKTLVVFMLAQAILGMRESHAQLTVTTGSASSAVERFVNAAQSNASARIQLIEIGRRSSSASADSAVALLVEELDHPDFFARGRALSMLLTFGEAGHSGAVPKLIARVPAAPHDVTERLAIMAHRIGPAELAVPWLVKLLQNSTLSDDAAVNAALALAQLGEHGLDGLRVLDRSERTHPAARPHIQAALRGECC